MHYIAGRQMQACQPGCMQTALWVCLKGVQNLCMLMC